MDHSIQQSFVPPHPPANRLKWPVLRAWFGNVGPLFGCLTVYVLFAADVKLSTAQGTIGMSIEWKQVVITGSELEVKPIKEDALPIVLKIDQTWPHGSDFRYDFSFYGLEEGTFDLKDYLRRKDGSPLGTIQPLTIEIETVLPANTFEPSAIQQTPIPEPGGYRNTMIALGMVWLVGLGTLLWSMRKGKPDHPSETIQTSAPTLAQKLEPLVKGAAQGMLSKEQQAQLERLLLSYWSQRLGLKSGRPADRIRQLKDHDQAGPLIRAIEQWLHSKNPVDDHEIQTLLEPYKSVSSDEAGDEASPPKA